MQVAVTTTTNRKGDLAKTLERVKAALQGPQNVKIGFPAGKAGADLVMRAVWNEFGTRGGASGGGWGGPIPERPFMRNTVAENRGDYRKMMIASGKAIVTGRMGMEQALSLFGQRGADDIKETIASGLGPANSPTTVKLKGSSRTLIDTGEMAGSVTYQVT